MKRSRVSPERRAFERQTLRLLRAAGAHPDELATARRCLKQGRKKPTDDLCTVLNKSSQEKMGIEYALRCLRGDPPEFIIFNMKPTPGATYHG